MPTRSASQVEEESHGEDEPAVMFDDTRILPEKSRIRSSKTDEQFNRFVEMIKHLNITLPLLDAL